MAFRAAIARRLEAPRSAVCAVCAAPAFSGWSGLKKCLPKRRFGCRRPREPINHDTNKLDEIVRISCGEPSNRLRDGASSRRR
jgi:hypothetical protein